MKRYRILNFDFDTRAAILSQEIDDAWKEEVKVLNLASKTKLQENYRNEYGDFGFEWKLQNVIDLGVLPISVLAFHNKFMHQIRDAFILGSYYPALTATCSLGERILNHLVLVLRDDFASTPEYNKIRNKESFDNWVAPINALVSWGVLLPKSEEAFRNLWIARNKSIHFRPEIDVNDRKLALEAIQLLNQIIGEQFSGFGPQPWFINGIVGESYIKKQVEQQPFIKRIYLSNGVLVGPYHTLDWQEGNFIPRDDNEYADIEITDDEFVELRNKLKHN